MNKPTFEELEAQVKQLAAQLELSVAAERAWETTMMRVCGEDGPLSVAGKFNQMAAENAALKLWVSQSVELWDAGCDMDGHMRDVPHSVSTDAYAASLRAEGVEMLAKQCEGYATNHVYSFTQRHALEFAAQLRSKSEVQHD